MKRTIKILILAVLFGSAFLVAENSSANENISAEKKELATYPSFWDRFRDSVTPKDKQPEPPQYNRNYKEPPPPPPPHHKVERGND